MEILGTFVSLFCILFPFFWIVTGNNPEMIDNVQNKIKNSIFNFSSYFILFLCYSFMSITLSLASAYSVFGDWDPIISPMVQIIPIVCGNAFYHIVATKTITLKENKFLWMASIFFLAIFLLICRDKVIEEERGLFSKCIYYLVGILICNSIPVDKLFSFNSSLPNRERHDRRALIETAKLRLKSLMHLGMEMLLSFKEILCNRKIIIYIILNVATFVGVYICLINPELKEILQTIVNKFAQGFGIGTAFSLAVTIVCALTVYVSERSRINR